VEGYVPLAESGGMASPKNDGPYSITIQVDVSITGRYNRD